MKLNMAEKYIFLQKYMKNLPKIFSYILTIHSPYGIFLTPLSTLKLLKTLLKMSKTVIIQCSAGYVFTEFVKAFS